jgi:hypothetical protein
MALMKRSASWIFIILILCGVFSTGCRKPDKKAGIPDTAELMLNIAWLDSLTRSAETDSVGIVNDSLDLYLQSYIGHAQSGDDKAILDSLERIHNLVLDFLRFCTDSRQNLEILQQDIKSTESKYHAGKITIERYISDILESEQVLNDLQEKILDKRQKSLQSLRSQSLLIKMLPPVSTFEGR